MRCSFCPHGLCTLVGGNKQTNEKISNMSDGDNVLEDREAE